MGFSFGVAIAISPVLILCFSDGQKKRWPINGHLKRKIHPKGKDPPCGSGCGNTDARSTWLSPPFIRRYHIREWGGLQEGIFDFGPFFSFAQKWGAILRRPSALTSASPGQAEMRSGGWGRTITLSRLSYRYVPLHPIRFSKFTIPKQNRSHHVNVVCDGSPSRIRMVRRISLGITTRPRSSMRRTIPVAFMVFLLRCAVAPTAFLYRSICSIRRIWKGIQIPPLVFFGRSSHRKICHQQGNANSRRRGVSRRFFPPACSSGQNYDIISSNR